MVARSDPLKGRRTLWGGQVPEGAQMREPRAATDSPRVLERLIPSLYFAARARGQPMTALVDDAIEAFLADLAASQAPQPAASGRAAIGGEEGGHCQRAR
jgi:hypothetical protein